jgi:glycosyltransferase involved in cell wall biosynthesis
MRIGFVYDVVYPYSKGGVEKRIADIARLMAARGHEVHILGTKTWDGGPDQVVDGVSLHGVCEPSDIHTKTGTRSVAQALRFAIAAARRITLYDLDVVELQGMSPLSCLVVLLRCRFSSISPIVIWYEVWRDYWNEYLGLTGYLGRLVEWLVARLAPAQAASSRIAIRRLAQWGLHDVRFLPIGIDYYGIRSTPRAALQRDIIYVGRLARHKNLDLLINAISRLEAQGISPRVAIVGEGPERARLEVKAESMGLDKVEFIGRVESDSEVISLMKSSRIFAFPSLREGYGLAPLEACATGIPVVAVHHPDNAACDLIQDGVTGVITPPEPTAFANALKGLLVDVTNRERMGRAALVAAEALDWSRVAGEAEQFYHEVHSGQSQASHEQIASSSR